MLDAAYERTPTFLSAGASRPWIWAMEKNHKELAICTCFKRHKLALPRGPGHHRGL